MREHSSHDNSTLKLLQMSDSFPLVCSNLKKKKLSNKIEKIQITPTQLRRISRMRTVDECENEDTPRLCTAAVCSFSIICAHSHTHRLSRSILILLHLSTAAVRSRRVSDECEDEDTPRLCAAQVCSFSFICPHSLTLRLSRRVEWMSSTLQHTATHCNTSVRMRTLLDSAQQECAHSPSFVLILTLIDSAGVFSFSFICPHSLSHRLSRRVE